MKFPFSWLKEFINLESSPSQIATILTSLGLEVDALREEKIGFSNVVFAKVISIQPHPHSSHLQLATLFDGSQEYKIVCGAQNCRKDLVTALAKVGAYLPSTSSEKFVIKEATIRGELSEGMLCSHDELGLEKDVYARENGIMEFDDSFTLGASVAEFYKEAYFEISLTPNLGHAQSLLGIARELHAATGASLIYPHSALKEDKKKASDYAQLEIIDKELCPKYAFRIIEGIEVKPSPLWLKRRLEQSGMRSVNAIVDITNYVLLEWGYPLHAFDLDQIEEKKVVVRRSKNHETLTTLDGKERSLTEDTLVISDAKKPIALAGIMGSSNSEVREKTQRILLEAAYFDPTSIRRTSKRLGLTTEASKRFERGVDPNSLLQALNRAAFLIQTYCKGNVAEGICESYSQSFYPWTVTCRPAHVNKLLGIQLAVNEMETLLRRLGLTIQQSNKDYFEVIIPTFRHDLKHEIDLIEEIARLYGYDHLRKETSPFFPSSTIPHHPLYLYEKKAREILLRDGLQEFLTCNLISPKLCELITPDAMQSRFVIKLLNPSSSDQSILRPSLLPNLLEVVKNNLDHEKSSIAGFEIGKIHFKTQQGYVEPTVFSIVMCGERHPLFWEGKGKLVDYYDLKGIVENFFYSIKLSAVQWEVSHYQNLHPYKQARLLLNNNEIGTIGQIHPLTLEKLDISIPVYFCEIHLLNVMAYSDPQLKMKELPLYPASTRDWTLTVPKEFLASAIEKAIQAKRPSLLESFSLIGVYEGEKLGKHLKNVTFRFVYRDLLHTISYTKVEEEHANFIKHVLEELKIPTL